MTVLCVPLDQPMRQAMSGRVGRINLNSLCGKKLEEKVEEDKLPTL